MSSKMACVWVHWLLLSSVLLAATADPHAAGDQEASKQPGRTLAADVQQVTITGCAAYSQTGNCTKCASPRYALTTDGSCDCAPGFKRTGTGSCSRGGHCANKCGQTYLPNGKGGKCSCDYWCDNHGDCCGGSDSKNSLCRSMEPTVNKARTGSCTATLTESIQSTSRGFRPSNCYCDAFCTSNNDCCPLCTQPTCNKQPSPGSDSKPAQTASVDAEDLETRALRAQIAAESAAIAEKTGHPGDCATHTRLQIAKAAIAASGTPSQVDYEVTAEGTMQQCQAADTGAPATPYVIPIHWTAARICSGSTCVGGKYSVADVQAQIAFNNKMYARTGIQFTWDGVIHTADASSIDQIMDDTWVCKLQRYGDKAYTEQPTIHVVTAPEHLGGALGYTWYASMFGYDGYEECLNWVHIYEKTLPGLGGASVVDGGLSDSGAVLAHEIGHQLMLHHTWYEAGQPSILEQCVGSASMQPDDIAAGKSDGVRDTPAQSQNGTRNDVTSILRFINCDPKTGAYNNRTAFAQQSCTSAVGFPAGDKYFNNFNNLMSYGDKTCLRTLTPGQSARARCAYKCMMQKSC